MTWGWLSFMTSIGESKMFSLQKLWRKPLEQKDYYALVDCRGQAYELMLLPYDTWRTTDGPPQVFLEDLGQNNLGMSNPPKKVVQSWNICVLNHWMFMDFRVPDLDLLPPFENKFRWFQPRIFQGQWRFTGLILRKLEDMGDAASAKTDFRPSQLQHVLLPFLFVSNRCFHHEQTGWIEFTCRFCLFQRTNRYK